MKKNMSLLRRFGSGAAFLSVIFGIQLNAMERPEHDYENIPKLAPLQESRSDSYYGNLPENPTLIEHDYDNVPETHPLNPRSQSQQQLERPYDNLPLVKKQSHYGNLPEKNPEPIEHDYHNVPRQGHNDYGFPSESDYGFYGDESDYGFYGSSVNNYHQPIPKIEQSSFKRLSEGQYDNLPSKPVPVEHDYHNVPKISKQPVTPIKKIYDSHYEESKSVSEYQEIPEQPALNLKKKSPSTATSEQPKSARKTVLFGLFNKNTSQTKHPITYKIANFTVDPIVYTVFDATKPTKSIFKTNLELSRKALIAHASKGDSIIIEVKSSADKKAPTKRAILSANIVSLLLEGSAKEQDNLTVAIYDQTIKIEDANGNLLTQFGLLLK